MIKSRTLFLFLLILLISSSVSGLTVYISGTIYNTQGGAKVGNHTVYVKTDFSSPFHYYKTIYSNGDGFYADTIENVPAYPIAFQVSTYDCNNNVHVVTILSTNSPGVADFYICAPLYSGCRAGFSYNLISGLNYQFTDLSVSNSNILSWEWNFGDPSSGTTNVSYLQNPSHTFSASNIYTVKLLMISSGGCRDSISKTVFINISDDRVIIYGRITNDNTGGPIANQPVMINITLIQYSGVVYSNNNGDYADTIPAVPDGIPISIGSYDCNNVLHSNTVYCSPAPVNIDFNICFNEQCRAGFSAVLDSNSRDQNTYRFQDLSFGAPNRWTWNFGDGSVGHDQNPVHQYTTPGNFTVRFTITEEDSTGAWICFDSTSRIIKTSSYYNLGGHLFAGLFPINNPHNTGDTGVAYLYRAHNKWIVPVDTSVFTFLGYYTFLHVLEGDYIVKAELTPGSSHYRDYLPAYCGTQIKWQSACPFSIHQDMFDNSIYLITAKNNDGKARLQGSVIHKDDDYAMHNAEVILFNNEMSPVSSVLTDNEGNFELTDIPYGTYNLYAEVTGKYSLCKEVIVDSLNPVASDQLLEVFDRDVTGIPPFVNGIKDTRIGNIFPNPFTDLFRFWIQSSETLVVDVEVITLYGEIVLSKSLGSITGRQLISVPLQNTSAGVYFLIVRSGDGSMISTQKVIKN
jgi:PKD repeat protein